MDSAWRKRAEQGSDDDDSQKRPAKRAAPEATTSASSSRPSASRTFDVLIGRGKGSYQSPGNLYLKKVIHYHLHKYMATRSNKVKTEITHGVVEQIKQAGGRFVGDASMGSAAAAAPAGTGYVEIEDEDARVKVGQAMRHLIRSYEDKKKKKVNQQPVAAPSSLSGGSAAPRGGRMGRRQKDAPGQAAAVRGHGNRKAGGEEGNQENNDARPEGSQGFYSPISTHRYATRASTRQAPSPVAPAARPEPSTSGMPIAHHHQPRRRTLPAVPAPRPEYHHGDPAEPYQYRRHSMQEQPQYAAAHFPPWPPAAGMVGGAAPVPAQQEEADINLSPLPPDFDFYDDDLSEFTLNFDDDSAETSGESR